MAKSKYKKPTKDRVDAHARVERRLFNGQSVQASKDEIIAELRRVADDLQWELTEAYWIIDDRNQAWPWLERNAASLRSVD